MLHAPADPIVRHFHQILLWPLELMPSGPTTQIQTPWERLLEDRPAKPWREVDDEFPGEPELFQERHYSEFVTFLPYVQRFLYGEGATRGAGARASRRSACFRRTDVDARPADVPRRAPSRSCSTSCTSTSTSSTTSTSSSWPSELAGDGLRCPRVQDTLYRLGRAYPTHWEHGRSRRPLPDPRRVARPPTAPCWPCPTTRSARSSSSTCAATARRPSPRTGSTC